MNSWQWQLMLRFMWVVCKALLSSQVIGSKDDLNTIMKDIDDEKMHWMSPYSSACPYTSAPVASGEPSTPKPTQDAPEEKEGL